MPIFTATVETTSNATAGASASNTAVQFLMPASRQAQLLRVLVKQDATAAGENSGRWVVDRISAVGSGSAFTPLELDGLGAASALTDATKVISTTVAATNTVVDAAILDLNDGWNDFTDLGVMSGANQGFAIRRATAPTGARIVKVVLVWRE